MNNKTKSTTDIEADMINYDYFSPKNVTRYMRLVDEYPDWDKKDIVRVEVRNQMFRVLSTDTLYDYFNPLYGWTKKYIRTKKQIIKIIDREYK